MTSIDTYYERINARKASIETLKNDETFNLRNPDGTVLIVRDSRDLFLPLGTVIAGNDEHVYLRVPHGNTYWTSSDRDNTEPYGYDLDQFYEFLRRRMEDGEQFRVVYQPNV